DRFFLGRRFCWDLCGKFFLKKQFCRDFCHYLDNPGATIALAGGTCPPPPLRQQVINFCQKLHAKSYLSVDIMAEKGEKGVN
ncbi:MAG: hypothetical protein LBC04_04090, partial [Holosporaceae bacterium]|nr:hypothetical protein [Holosporaceae bacterium]